MLATAAAAAARRAAYAHASPASSSPSHPLRGAFTGAAQRWYKEATVEARPDGTHAVLLDGRSIRTPARRPLLLPSHLLAAAVAAEWAAQPPSRVRPFTMPLMSLAAMALDQPKPAGAVVDGLLRYLDTDSAAVRAPAGAGPLADAQAAAFDPVLAWAEGRFGTPFATSAAITGAPQPPPASAAVRAHLASLSPWRLAPVAALAGAAKSVLVAVAVEGGGLSAGEALALARLEERLQSEEWGVVEGGHDVDEAASAVAVLGPAAFLRLLECGE